MHLHPISTFNHQQSMHCILLIASPDFRGSKCDYKDFSERTEVKNKFQLCIYIQSVHSTTDNPCIAFCLLRVLTVSKGDYIKLLTKLTEVETNSSYAFTSNQHIQPPTIDALHFAYCEF